MKSVEQTLKLQTESMFLVGDMVHESGVFELVLMDIGMWHVVRVAYHRRPYLITGGSYPTYKP